MSDRTRIDWERLQEEDEEYIRELTAVDPTNLQAAMENQPWLYYLASRAYEKARSRREKAEGRVEFVEAEEFNRYREANDFAIDHCNAKVDQSSRVQKARQRARRARADERLKRALRNALEQRKDMIVQMSAMQRTELQQ